MPYTEKLQRCFREALDLPPHTDPTGLAYQEHPSWDSVAHMRLVASIETAFDIMMETDEILAMSTYDKALGVLKAHNVAAAA